MKLLILTQKIDANDPILGFFVRWVTKFAKQWEHVHVICLEKGEHDLPPNVTVHSLGKEELEIGNWKLGIWHRLRYLFRFYKHIWRTRRDYDSVFVHMNSIYINLAWLFWKGAGKRVGLWYNHTDGGFSAYAAAQAADHVFHTSPFAYTAQFKNAQQMPAGIDTDQFKRDTAITRTQNSILFIGRIAPIKGVHVLVEAANTLHERGINFTLNIYGDPLSEHADYLARTKERAAALIEKGNVVFHRAVPNDQTPTIYNAHEVFVNLTPAGNYDKTVLEAMACECNIVASSEAFADILPSTHQFAENDATDLADTLQELLTEKERAEERQGFEEPDRAEKSLALKSEHNHKQETAQMFRTYVTQNHSLPTLSEQVFQMLSK